MAHDQDPGYVLAAGSVFLVLCIISVSLRVLTRYLQKARLGIDDWLTIPALLMVIGCSLVLIIGVDKKVLAYPTPAPKDLQDPDDEHSVNFTTVEKLEWAFFLMQIMSMGFTKLSFIFFFRRIFVTSRRSLFSMVSACVLILVVLWCLAFFLWFLLSCGNKFATRWTTINTLHHNCPSDIKSDLALAISDFLTDVMILGLPIPMVLRLQMSTSRKFAVLAVFGLGAVALVASIIRLALFVNITGIASGKIKDPNADNDLLTTRSLFWSMLESGLALIACCLPSLNYLAGLPPFRSVIDSFRNITSIRSSSEHYKMSQGNDNSQLKAEDQSLASRKALVPESADSAEIETYAMGDVPKINHGRRAGKDGIWVDKVVEQENYIV
ncbi:hypothetical protein sscle_09g069000 [Sclerotinia sclerotiorum 1980 UF-70]|uniref:Rhodopsin domain-containing protein n=1 Tax=Sclerotinia sclerotiorum (strain ATCC 18683 / 1980 / Ss-1) TaxID=665079 RepID=A0A1D9QAZ1_SCLS1|nr:hypothetical protein sscle_09g069000 [Sclerotinia sclerotiorum 1980 UF-70]